MTSFNHYHLIGGSISIYIHIRDEQFNIEIWGEGQKHPTHNSPSVTSTYHWDSQVVVPVGGCPGRTESMGGFAKGQWATCLILLNVLAEGCLRWTEVKPICMASVKGS